MSRDRTPEIGADPWEVLGISADADEEAVRKAYLAKIRQFPPDRAPEQFERIRDAYECVKDPAIRMGRLLNLGKLRVPLASQLDSAKGRRSFAGPKPWLAILKDK